MSKLKIRFLKDHQQFDEKMLEFAEGEVCSMNEASAMHYVNRQVAELVGAKTKVGKPEKQIKMDDPPADDPPADDPPADDPPADDRTLGQKIKDGAKAISDKLASSDDPPADDPPAEKGGKGK